MKLKRKAGLVLVSALVGVGLLGMTAPAHAYQDTNWPCSTCFAGGHR